MRSAVFHASSSRSASASVGSLLNGRDASHSPIVIRSSSPLMAATLAPLSLSLRSLEARMPAFRFTGLVPFVYPESRDALGRNVGQVEPGDVREFAEAPDYMWVPADGAEAPTEPAEEPAEPAPEPAPDGPQPAAPAVIPGA